MGHPSAVVLKRFSAGTASREEAATIVAHLLGGCHACAEQLRELSRPKEIGAGAYDAVFARLETAAAAPGPSRGSAPDPELLLKELLAQPEARQKMMVRNSLRYLHSELALLLAKRSYDLRYKDPERLHHFAQLGAIVAKRLDSRSFGNSARFADIKARCFSELCNSLKIIGDLPGADRVLGAAFRALNEGTGDPALRACLFERLASLRCNQRRLDESIQAYEETIAFLRDGGKPHELARALVGQAVALGYAGDPEKALTLLLEAMPKIDGELDPRLTLAACSSVVFCQLETGRVEEAALNWVDLRSLFEKLGDPLIRTKKNWIEGKLMMAQGLVPVGLKLLDSSRQDYLERGLHYDAALVSLDIGMGYSRLGRIDDLRNLMSEILPVFRALQVSRESLVTLIFLRMAAELEAPVSERV